MCIWDCKILYKGHKGGEYLSFCLFYFHLRDNAHSCYQRHLLASLGANGRSRHTTEHGNHIVQLRSVLVCEQLLWQSVTVVSLAIASAVSVQVSVWLPVCELTTHPARCWQEKLFHLHTQSQRPTWCFGSWAVTITKCVWQGCSGATLCQHGGTISKAQAGKWCVFFLLRLRHTGKEIARWLVAVFSRKKTGISVYRGAGGDRGMEATDRFTNTAKENILLFSLANVI